MRERGLDPSTCDQIGEIACSIRSTSSLYQSANERARLLAAVLRYLESRLGMMLAADTGSVPSTESNASDVSGDQAGTNGRASMPGCGIASPHATAPAQNIANDVAGDALDAAAVELAAVDEPSPSEQAGVKAIRFTEIDVEPLIIATPAGLHHRDSDDGAAFESATTTTDPWLPAIGGATASPVAAEDGQMAAVPATQDSCTANDAPQTEPDSEQETIAAAAPAESAVWVASRDPLAALKAMSDEERIALFT
jgi:hypothetical protein